MREQDNASLQISKIKPFGQLDTKSSDQRYSSMRKISKSTYGNYLDVKSGVSSPARVERDDISKTSK